jgi:hypothetical protein
MADFCRDCMVDALSAPELVNRNDFCRLEFPAAGICEGCGLHVFLPGGIRCHREPFNSLVMDRCAPCAAWLREHGSEVDAGWWHASLVPWPPPRPAHPWADDTGTLAYRLMTEPHHLSAGLDDAVSVDTRTLARLGWPEGFL